MKAEIQVTAGGEDVEFIPLMTGRLALSPITAALTLEGGEELTLTIEYDDATGRFVCKSISGTGINDAVLRDLSITTVIAEAVARTLLPSTRKEHPEDAQVSVLLREQAKDPVAFMTEHPHEDVLTVLAAWYSFTFAVGLRPAKEVMKRLGVSRSTASRWIAEARELGLLGPTTQGKAAI